MASRSARRAARRAARLFGPREAIAARERAIVDRLRAVTAPCADPRVPAGPLVWPVLGRITSRFGDRVGRPHTGIDIAAPEGTPVRAAAGGRVVLAEVLDDYGTTLVLDHGDGFTTLYAHQRGVVVAVGDAVERDQVVGAVGATGRASGPHLHVETRVDTEPRDPVALLPPDGDPATTLRAGVTGAVGAALAGVTDVVIVGSTLHDNAGDSLIWLGQIALLERLGIRIAAVVHPASYDRTPFDRAPRDAVVLLSGGGNFGDLWPFVHRHREWVLREVTGRRIVQLPQSLHFADGTNARVVEGALEARDDVVLMWRDRASLAAARTRFPTTPSVLAPDVAYARAAPGGVRTGGDGIVWVARGDREGGALRAAPVHVGRRTDWRLRPGDELARQGIWLAARVERRLPGPSRTRARMVLYDRSALLTAGAAAATVRGAAAVITDRLHAHVLCTMLGVPHVIVDDGYGKIAAFIETWPVTHGFAHVARSVAEAEELARGLTAPQRAPVR